MNKGIIVLVAVALILIGFKASAHENLKANQVPHLSVQLWSVRDLLTKDFEGTLKSVAALGFQGVELYSELGPYKDNPQGLKAFLDGIGLKVSGAHVSFEQLNDKNLAETLAYYGVLGTDLLIVGWDERAWHPEGVKEIVALLNHISPSANKQGFRVGFHNHDQEFNDYAGTTYWDYLASNTDQTVLLQLDIGWVNYAGKDPIAYVKRYPYRTLTTHLKVTTHKGSKQSPILGQDGYNWAALIHTMVHEGGTRWLVVEQEEYPDGLSSLESVAKSKQGLDAIIAGMK